MERERKVYIIIFSCRSWKEYVSRTECALGWALDHEADPIFIFSGSRIAPFKIVANPYRPKPVFWRDSVPRNTRESIESILGLFKTYSLYGQEIRFVSSWYHIPRIKVLLYKYGQKFADDCFITSNKGINGFNIVIELFIYIATILNIDNWRLIKKIRKCWDRIFVRVECETDHK